MEHANEVWIYLATVLDLYSRKIVGFATADHMKTALPQEALRMALEHQKPTGEIIHHSDRGSQYASKDYQKDLKTAKITPSMSRKGNCYDNAPQESFFKTLKTELVYHTIYKTKQQAKIDLFKYIEIYYNAKRIHSSINYLTPNQMFKLAA